MYDTTKPRFEVITNTYPCSNFETLSESEAKFWVELGFMVSRAEWNGKIFEHKEYVKNV